MKRKSKERKLNSAMTKVNRTTNKMQRQKDLDGLLEIMEGWDAPNMKDEDAEPILRDVVAAARGENSSESNEIMFGLYPGTRDGVIAIAGAGGGAAAQLAAIAHILRDQTLLVKGVSHLEHVDETNRVYFAKWRDPLLSERDAMTIIDDMVRKLRAATTAGGYFNNFETMKPRVLAIAGEPRAAKDRLRDMADVMEPMAIGKKLKPLTGSAGLLAEWRAHKSDAEAVAILKQISVLMHSTDPSVVSMWHDWPAVQDQTRLLLNEKGRSPSYKLTAITELMEADVEDGKRAAVGLPSVRQSVYTKWLDPETTDEEAAPILAEIIKNAKRDVRAKGTFIDWQGVKAKLLAAEARTDIGAAAKLCLCAEIMKADDLVREELAKVNKNPPRNADGSVSITLTDFVRMADGVTEEKYAQLMLSQIMGDAAKDLHERGLSEHAESIFYGFATERDAVMRIIAEDGSTWIQKLKAVNAILRPMIPAQEAKIESIEAEIKLTEEQLAKKRIISELLERLAAAEARGWVLQPNDCSRIHKLYEAIKAKRMAGMLPKSEVNVQTHQLQLDEDYLPFVVKHNWAAVLGDSDGDVTGEALLPAPKCAFEFRISGFNVIYLVQDPKEAGYKPLFPGDPTTLFVEASADHWIIIDRVRSIYEFVRRQYEAACIVLESKAATSTLTLPPAALNKKRLAQGKLPLYSFHTVDLNRTKVKRQHGPAADEPTHRKRLHFCRSHDRTYQSGLKIRVPWCLKGDPDLGVVDKIYLL